jgi:hypothetical protein
MNADISYIMSCSDAEFEKVTGVRLPDEAWERWCNDMEERKEQLLLVVQKAIETEREACAKYVEQCYLPDAYSQDCLPEIADEIRARGQA